MPDDLLNVREAAAHLGIKPWTLRHWISDRKIDFVKYGNGLVRSGAAYLTVIWQVVRSRRKSVMQTDARRNHDYSKGPVWDETRNRWLVEIRYPDGSRFRKRLRREREAMRLWAGEQTKIENGTWDARAARNVTVGEAMKQYREYSKVQHRSHDSYIDPSLTLWEAHLGPQTHLARVGSQQVADFKLKRAQKVARSTTDKDVAILKAFFNWCIAHELTVSNPVRVKLFHEDNLASSVSDS